MADVDKIDEGIVDSVGKAKAVPLLPEEEGKHTNLHLLHTNTICVFLHTHTHTEGRREIILLLVKW